MLAGLFTMILESKAQYDGANDIVHVVSWILLDDSTPATPALSSGTVQLLQGNETEFTLDFDRRDVMLIPQDDGVTFTDIGQFYCFVMHPAQQRNLTARVTATLADGSTATVVMPVEYNRENQRAATLNPMISGRENPQFPQDPNKP